METWKSRKTGSGHWKAAESKEGVRGGDLGTAPRMWRVACAGVQAESQAGPGTRRHIFIRT